MTEIEDYHLCSGINAYHLRESVLLYLSKGYCPYGNPYAMPESREDCKYHCQAVVKVKRSDSGELDGEDLR